MWELLISVTANYVLNKLSHTWSAREVDLQENKMRGKVWLMKVLSWSCITTWKWVIWQCFYINSHWQDHLSIQLCLFTYLSLSFHLTIRTFTVHPPHVHLRMICRNLKLDNWRISNCITSTPLPHYRRISCPGDIMKYSSA